MKYARIENEVVLEVINFDPTGKYHESIVWYEVPEDVVPGAITADNINFTLPEPEPEPELGGEPPPERIVNFVTVMHFKLSFLPQERVQINELRKTDSVIDDFYTILDDPRCVRIDLNLPSIQAAVNSFVGRIEGFTQERANEILSGTIK